MFNESDVPGGVELVLPFDGQAAPVMPPERRRIKTENKDVPIETLFTWVQRSKPSRTSKEISFGTL